MNRLRLLLITVVLLPTIILFIIKNYISFLFFTGIAFALEGYLLFSSISLGFFGTCVSIIASILNTNVVRKIMGNDTYKLDFVIMSVLTILSGFLSILATIGMQIVDSHYSENHKVIENIVPIWYGTSISYVLSLSIFILTILLIFWKADDQKDERPKSVDITKKGKNPVG